MPGLGGIGGNLLPFGVLLLLLLRLLPYATPRRPQSSLPSHPALTAAMLTVLPPSCTLTDESLQELLSSSRESGANTTTSSAEAFYLIVFSSTLPALSTWQSQAPAPASAQDAPLDESQLATLKEGLWCPDCRAALQAVLSVFLPSALPAGTGTANAQAIEESEPRALLVQVSREQWKDRTDGGHAYRRRYDVQSVPTILKWLGVSTSGGRGRYRWRQRELIRVIPFLLFCCTCTLTCAHDRARRLADWWTTIVRMWTRSVLWYRAEGGHDWYAPPHATNLPAFPSMSSWCR